MWKVYTIIVVWVEIKFPSFGELIITLELCDGFLCELFFLAFLCIEMESVEYYAKL